MVSIADDMYATATNSNIIEDLDVHALSMPGLVETFKAILRDVGKNGDSPMTSALGMHFICELINA